MSNHLIRNLKIKSEKGKEILQNTLKVKQTHLELINQLKLIESNIYNSRFNLLSIRSFKLPNTNHNYFNHFTNNYFSETNQVSNESEHFNVISEIQNNLNEINNKDIEKQKTNLQIWQKKISINNSMFSNYVQIINSNKYKVNITISFQ